MVQDVNNGGKMHARDGEFSEGMTEIDSEVILPGVTFRDMQRRISELEAERDEAIAAARAFKHAFDIPITQDDIDRAVEEARRIAPLIDAERIRRVIETEIVS
jgi:hypothetical protein